MDHRTRNTDSDFRGTLTPEEQQAIIRAYNVFKLDPRNSFTASGDGEFGFRFPKLSVAFLREKAKNQLRDALGRWRKMRGKLDGDDDGAPVERAHMAKGGIPLDLDSLPRPSRLVKAYGSDFERTEDGRVIIPSKMIAGFKGDNTLLWHLEDAFDRNGNAVKALSREREALHDELLSRVFDGIEPPRWRKPMAYYMGGGSGAGKSSATKALEGYPRTRELKEYGKEPHGEAALLDADAFKTALPEWAQLSTDDAAPLTHEESSLLTKLGERRAQELGVDYVLDGTGDGNPEKMTNKIDKAIEAGYETRAIYVTIPTEEAIVRSVARGVETERMVPIRMLQEIHAKVSQVAPSVMPKVGRFDLFDQDVPFGTPPIPIVANSEIVNQEKYDEFLSKGLATQYSDFMEQLEYALGAMQNPEWDPVPGNKDATPEYRESVRQGSIRKVEKEIRRLNEDIEEQRLRKLREMGMVASQNPMEENDGLLDIERWNALIMAVNSGIPKEEVAETVREEDVYDYLVGEKESNQEDGYGFDMVNEFPDID